MIAKFKNAFLGGEKSLTSITEAAFLIAVMGLASRILGLFRDRILASKFGAGDILDVYYAAFKIPDLIFNLLILGALSAAFLPVFTSLLSKEKKEESWQLASTVISIGSVLLGAVVFLLFIFCPQLVRLITFGFDVEKQNLVVTFTRVILLSPWILGISGIIGGVLSSFKKFFFYSLAPIFYNVGIIIGAWFFTDWWGPIGLALGVVLGAILHLLIQLPEVIRCGLKFKFNFDYQNQHLRKIGALMIPRTMGLAVTQINLLVITVLASTLPSGSLSIFNFANNLQSVPLGLFGISFAVASFPTLAGLWAEDKKEEFIFSLAKVFRRILFFVIPFSMVFILLRAQIVRVVLGSGQFGWEETILTYQALMIFSFSLFAQCLIPLLTRVFYAIHDTYTPFFSGLVSEVINFILAIIFIRWWGILGLISAFSLATIINAILLTFILRQRIGTLGEKEILKGVSKVIVATLAAGATIQIIKTLIGSEVALETFLQVFVQLVVSLLSGMAVFFAVGKLLGIEELDQLILILKKKIFKKNVSISDSIDEVAGI